ncbi:SWIM zinc finger family protein [Ilumatobacter sp.]|uniref:SWIM zinc finger family protein n=1 Tax=Ilumatobacter sp. TaxID=1967498 RepID=UPI003B52ADA9
MSRPRKPFGARQPGRLPSTMMKVLAAEMSDPGRLRRGKQYAKDGSVLDIVVEAGIVTCEIQGSRSTPYVASLEVTAGDGMPLRRDVHAMCTCPDDDWDDHACKHVLAAMFCFADELLIEPSLLDVWRANASAGGTDGAGTDDQEGGEVDGGGSDDADDLPVRRRHLELVRDGMERGRAERRERLAERRPEPVDDPLAELLSLPEGSRLPDIGAIERDDATRPSRPELAEVLGDAVRHLRIDWD